jgi:hypothetical protein
MLEHTERVLAILQAQRRHYQMRRQRQRKQRLGFEEEVHKDVSNSEKYEKEAEEFAAISRQYSQGSIEMAKVMGKADAFAVSVDDHKCIHIAWIRDQDISKFTGDQDGTENSEIKLSGTSTRSSCSMMSRTTSTAA